MKHFKILFTAIFLLSCTDKITDPVSNNETDIAPPGIRSTTMVEQIAISAVEQFSCSSTKSNETKKILNIIPNSPISKSASSLPLFYVVNFDDCNGFVVVGASESAPEVIVYSEKGNYDGFSSRNEGFNIYMNEISRQISISSTYDNNIPPPGNQVRTTIATSTEENAPLVQVSWHQHEPFNWYCSSPFNDSIPAGCVAIAIAQIMTAYSSPSSISLTYPGASTSSISFDWDEITNLSHTYSHSATCQHCIQNAALVREIGKRVGMQYAVGESRASSSNAPAVFSSFGYNTSSYSGYSLNSVMSSLNSGRPVYIRAENAETNGSGHAWVTDGSKYICETKITHNVSTKELLATEYTENWYLHFNYGWGGLDDGYYLAYQRKHGSGSLIYGGSYDYYPITIFSGAENLSYNVKIITDIRPK